MLPILRFICPKGHTSLVDQTREVFLFSLTSLIEKVQQHNRQHTERYQRTDHSQYNHNGFIDCHMRHLPSYGFRQAGHWLGRLPPRRGYFPTWFPMQSKVNTINIQLQSNKLLNLHNRKL